MTTDNEVRDVVKSTIADVLDLDDDSVITDATTAKDIPGWDSLRHVRIMLSLERKFKLTLTDDEITSLKNVGDICTVIQRKVSEGA